METFLKKLTVLPAMMVCAAICLSSVAAATLSSCAGGNRSATAASAASADTLRTVAVSADSLYSHVAKQVELGPRTPGSTAHGRCVELITGYMNVCGVDTTMVQTAPVTTFKGEKFTAKNIFAQINRAADNRVLLLAHYDTRPWADSDPDEAMHGTPIDGANDGASGVAVLMEVATGDIKAISNLEKSKTSGQYIEGMNRAVLGFEPGSVVKPISMLLALEDGLVSNINQTITIGNSYAYAGGRAITDSHYNSSLTVKGVIEESSNIGMTRIITNSAGPYHNDPSQFHKRLAEIGFLEPMNTGIAGERVPNVPATKSRISLSRMCYGYATEIPPLYTLSIYNAIANGGRYVRPRLVKELIGADFDSVLPVTYIRDRICSEKNAEKLREMLKAVVWGDRGTARAWVRDENVAIAGKTGTCYMIENGRYNTSRKRLAFCGFFPADDPLYSCIVLTCNPKQQWTGAASTSGQVMKNIAKKMYSRGMLGNSSDYREISEEGTHPVFYASTKGNAHSLIKRSLDIVEAKEIASNVTANPKEGRVPSVVGLGLREAVVKIEEAGYNVSFTGNGYVRSQSPGAGLALKEGEHVRLSLTEF